MAGEDAQVGIFARGGGGVEMDSLGFAGIKLAHAEKDTGIFGRFDNIILDGQSLEELLRTLASWNPFREDCVAEHL